MRLIQANQSSINETKLWFRNNNNRNKKKKNRLRGSVGELMANLQIVPAYKNVEAQYVEMMVPLYSYGCEKKVKKALSNLKGIYSVSVDYKLQKVTVWGICNKFDVLATIRSKRKEARFWNCEEEIEPFAPEPTKPIIRTMLRSLSWKAWLKVIKSY